MSTHRPHVQGSHESPKADRSNSKPLTPREWNSVSQRLIGYSNQISKVSREVTTNPAEKTVKS